MDAKLENYLNNFLSNLIKKLKNINNNQKNNSSNYNFINFKNYIVKQLDSLSSNDYLEYINEQLKMSFSSKQSIRYIMLKKNNVRIIINNLNTKQKSLKHYLMNILPKLKFLKKSNKFPYKIKKLIYSDSIEHIITLENHPDKILRVINININNTIYSLINEILIMEKLNNSNISPKIYDYFIYLSKNKHKLYIIQEKMDYSLNTWIKKGNILTTSKKIEILNITKQLHKLKIIHNNINYNNIQVKIINNNPIFYLSNFRQSKLYPKTINELKKEELIKSDILNLNIRQNLYLNIILAFVILLDISENIILYK